MKLRNPFEEFEEYLRIFILAGEVELAREIFRRHKIRIQRHPNVYPFSSGAISSWWFQDLVKNPIPPKPREAVYVPYGTGFCDGCACNDA
jgi:hypothetical protein